MRAGPGHNGPRTCVGVPAHPVSGELDLGAMGRPWDQHPRWGGMVGTLGMLGMSPRGARHAGAREQGTCGGERGHGQGSPGCFRGRRMRGAGGDP